MKKIIDVVPLRDGSYGLPNKASEPVNKTFSDIGGWLIFISIMVPFLFTYFGS